MLKGSKLSIVLEAEEIGAQAVKHSRALSHHYLGGKLLPRLCVSVPVDTGMAGFCCFVVDSGGQST